MKHLTYSNLAFRDVNVIRGALFRVVDSQNVERILLLNAYLKDGNPAGATADCRDAEGKRYIVAQITSFAEADPMSPFRIDGITDAEGYPLPARRCFILPV